MLAKLLANSVLLLLHKATLAHKSNNIPFFTNVPRKDNNSPHRHQKIISGYCACSLFYFSYKNEINKTLPNMSLISLIYQDGPFLLNLVDFFSDDGIANANLDFQLPTKWFPAIHQLKRSIIIWIAHQLLNGIKLNKDRFMDDAVV